MRNGTSRNIGVYIATTVQCYCGPHVFVCDISGNSQKLNLENRFIDQGRRSPPQQQQGGNMEIIQIVTILIILTLQLRSGGGRERWLWLTNDVN